MTSDEDEDPTWPKSGPATPPTDDDTGDNTGDRNVKFVPGGYEGEDDGTEDARDRGGQRPAGPPQGNTPAGLDARDRGGQQPAGPPTPPSPYLAKDEDRGSRNSQQGPSPYPPQGNTPAGLDARDRGGQLPAGPTPYPQAKPPSGGGQPPQGGQPKTNDSKPQTNEEYNDYLAKYEKDNNLPPGTYPRAGKDKGANSSGGQPPQGQPQPQARPSSGGGQPPQGGQPPSGGQPQAPRWTAQQEQAYLDANPDVAKAVRDGIVSSGQDHYNANGRSEGRKLTAAIQTQNNQAKAQNDAMAAELASLRAAQAQRDAIAKETADRAKQVDGIKATISGVGAGGGQIVKLNGDLPKVMSESELRNLAARHDFGYEAVALAYRNQGGTVGDWKPSTPTPAPAASPGAFDEAGYLANNSDVAAAVARGEYKSGLDHWQQRGRNEVRPGGRAFTPAEIAERATWPTGNPPPTTSPQGQPPPTTPATTPPTSPPVATPQRPPADERGITPPRQGDFDGKGNIWDADKRTWVPYTPATPPSPQDQDGPPPLPTITTGQNADSNLVAAGRFIETLPGGTSAWEYNDIENVVVNRITGERREVPSASLP